jgi:hypothetical protein
MKTASTLCRRSQPASRWDAGIERRRDPSPHRAAPRSASLMRSLLDLSRWSRSLRDRSARDGPVRRRIAEQAGGAYFLRWGSAPAPVASPLSACYRVLAHSIARSQSSLARLAQARRNQANEEFKTARKCDALSAPRQGGQPPRTPPRERR